MDSLKGECVAYVCRWGGLVFIVYVFPNWMVIRILWCGIFFLIVVRLIRDNWKIVIGNYHISLICEIWFDLQDK